MPGRFRLSEPFHASECYMFVRLLSLVTFLSLLSACPTAPVDPDPNDPLPPTQSNDAGTDAVCDPCTTGMALDDTDCSCTDIDECATDNGGCDENAACENAATSGDAPSCTCESGYFGDGLKCNAWTACEVDEYESTAPTTTTDRTCAALTVCVAAEYESTAATPTSDRVCMPLTVCTSAEFETTEPTATSDRGCTPLTECTNAEYETSEPTATSDRRCAPLTICTATEYESTAATAISDRVCVPVSVCATTEYETTEPTPISDRGCTPLTVCTNAEYETTEPTATSDRGCTPLTVCTNAEYESTGPTAASDRGCTPLTLCNSDEYASTQATATSDRVCTALTVCDGNATEAQSPTATADRVCVCNTGYVGSGATCSDFDECQTNNGGCDDNATCQNAVVAGDAALCTCVSGFYGDGQSCTEWAVCTSDEYESTAPDATTNRVCTGLTVCAPDDYISVPSTATSDRVCTDTTICHENATETQAPTETSDRVCACDAGYDGDGVTCVDVDMDDDGYDNDVDCNDINSHSTHQSIDPGCVFETALVTGDASGLASSDVPLAFALEYLAGMTTHAESALSNIYGDASLIYTPSNYSQWIETSDYQNKFTLVLGEQGNSLAVAGVHHDTPCAAFGENVVKRFMDGNEQDAFEPAFRRLLAWLVEGDADNHDEAVMASKEVGLMGLGGQYNKVYNWFDDAYPVTTLTHCNDINSATACVSNLDLLVVGANGDNADAEDIEYLVDQALYDGTPVLYLHTKGWDESDYGNSALAGMSMSIGPYGGNFWAADQAQWASIEDLLAADGPLDSIAVTLAHLQNNDLAFDFSVCTNYVGKVSCDDVEGLQNSFLAGAQKAKNFFKHLDETGQRLFDMDGKRFWRALLLYTDRLRQDIAYPMSKTDTDIMPFMKAYFADHVVHYSRSGQMSQPDLGSFSDPFDMDSVALVTTEKTIELSIYGGFTAMGAYVLPGQPFTIERLDEEDLDLHFKINTQRIGSTREWNDNKYDRPKFLQSPEMPIETGAPITYTSPYGGVLQVISDATETAPTITLRLTLVGEHPVLTDIADADAYLAALQNSPYPITELKMGGVEIHSKADKMLEAINADPYNGDLDFFFTHLDHYMIKDTYNLAGYAGAGLSLNASVAAYCTDKGWDCTSETIHASPSTQHINVDTYAHCGGGCSGNPYDQVWPLGPLGWGETHEIGHNLQPGRLKIHGGQSTEVSNQIFPLHKHYVYQQDTDESLSADRVAYSNTFNILQASVSENDPSQYVYDAIWSNESYAANNGERMNFYVQLIHTSDALDYLSSGWDLYTLLYLQERLFGNAIKNESDWDAQKAALGFGTYADAPNDMDGNDFMLVAVSYITQKDQRDFFEMWGITYSDTASTQVADFGYDAAPKIYFANDDTNTDPHSPAVPIDGVSAYPLP
ncbi:MAG: hypothetical protein CMH56_03590 [Myxococcales bacterium]|nr:hypothetical protein [Myxococcales bacterium]